MEKIMKKIILLVIFATLLLSMAACGINAQQSDDIVTPQTTAMQKEAEEKPPEKSSISDTVTIMDMAGRQHELPKKVTRVFATNPVGTVLLYTLAPNTVVGWNYDFNAHEREFILDEYEALPMMGTIKTVNAESLIAANVDFILSAASLSEGMQKKMDEFQNILGIPIVMVDESLAKTSEVYAFLGEILGEQQRAKQLFDYADDVFATVDASDVSQPVSIYYGNGINSLDTSSMGTPPSEIFDIIGAVNVCAVSGDAPDRIAVTAEHLIDWNADFIFVNGEPTEGISGNDAANDIYTDAKYKNLDAVKGKRVISIPKAPFAWLDRPRSANRLIGIKWAGSILYPESYSFDDSDIKEFYKLFYNMDLSDEQVGELLVR
jgi:iron complex transport system substrate-binding protein